MRLSTPALARLPSEALVERVVENVLRDIDASEHGGEGVAALLDAATLRRGGKSFPLAAQVAAARWRPYSVTGGRGHLPGGRVQAAWESLPVGEYAVTRRNLPAVTALAARAGGSAFCAMIKQAVTLGWTPGVRAILAGDASGMQTRYWLPEVLPHAMASAELLEAVATTGGMQAEPWESGGGSLRRQEAVSALVAMAMSLDPEALLETLHWRAPVLAADLVDVAEKGTSKERDDFFLFLASHAAANGYLAPRGLEFLARRVCRSRDCVGRLALAWVACGRDTGGDGNGLQAWTDCCRRQPHVAAGFAAEAGTARYVRRLVQAIDEWISDGQAMDWVRALAPLGGRMPVARFGEGMEDGARRLYEGWIAARGEAALRPANVAAIRVRRRV